MKILNIVFCLYLSTLAMPVTAQAPVSPGDNHPDRTEVIEPFRIVDNIYFVGDHVHNPSYLLTGSKGHIIIDTAYNETVPAILRNVEKLGFNPKDIKLILGTHAHADHVGGHSLMQEMTGASIVASAADVAVIETGGEADFRPGEWLPAEVDRVVSDGEVIRLGDIEIGAHLTPGHTRGCMSFTTTAEAGMEKYNVLFFGGARIAARPVVGHPEYPDMAKDFTNTFAKLQAMPVDIFLGGHGYWYDLRSKMDRMKTEGFRAFIDPEGYRKAVDGWQQQFVEQLLKEATALQQQASMK